MGAATEDLLSTAFSIAAVALLRKYRVNWRKQMRCVYAVTPLTPTKTYDLYK